MNINKLRGEIVEHYKTQIAFANAIGWHKNKLSRMMQGKYKPNTDEVAQIAIALGLDEKRFCTIFLPCKSTNGEKML